MKSAYVCGPLTDLNIFTMGFVKSFYSNIADSCLRTTGIRAFVPHEHYDPIKFAQFTPKEVDKAERDQVCNKTSLVIAVYVAPSWGSGIEVEMARQSNVPVIILCPMEKKVSRLLKGNPAVVEIIEYEGEVDALLKLEAWLRCFSFLIV